jgi:hypothetical protein
VRSLKSIAPLWTIEGTTPRQPIEVVADRGYFNSLEILACHEAGIRAILPKPRAEM